MWGRVEIVSEMTAESGSHGLTTGRSQNFCKHSWAYPGGGEARRTLLKAGVMVASKGVFEAQLVECMKP